MAVRVAVAVNTDGRREILGVTVMPSDAFTGLTRPHCGHGPRSPFWADFLRSLTRRGLRGVQMVISDAHEGLKAFAVQTVPRTVC
jgi:transposase-like protein